MALLLCLELCMAALQPTDPATVQAKERPIERTGEWTGRRELASRGNLLYQDSGERVGIFAADFFLLEEKLSSVPEEIFDPAAYGNGNAPEQKAMMPEPEEAEEILETPEPEEMEEEQEESVSENNCEEGESL